MNELLHERQVAARELAAPQYALLPRSSQLQLCSAVCRNKPHRCPTCTTRHAPKQMQTTRCAAGAPHATRQNKCMGQLSPWDKYRFTTKIEINQIEINQIEINQNEMLAKPCQVLAKMLQKCPWLLKSKTLNLKETFDANKPEPERYLNPKPEALNTKWLLRRQSCQLMALEFLCSLLKCVFYDRISLGLRSPAGLQFLNLLLQSS